MSLKKEQELASSAENSAANIIRVVGIGASAGGLKPLEQLLKHTPKDSNLAYIVVQHLDPDHKGMLPEILQRVTEMPVKEATQGMKLKADHVYVIPPNSELSVLNNCLHLAKPTKVKGLRLPIDVLLLSLAKAQGKLAIGVILSGMGADGTVGLQAIKKVGGLTLAQDPETAEYDSMPATAIAAKCVDIIAEASELASHFVAKIKHRNNKLKTQTDTDTDTDSDSNTQIKPTFSADETLLEITKLLHQKTGHDFSLYKTNTLMRRIERRQAIHNIDTVGEYLEFIQKNSQEIELLFKELLIGVTSFFRDPAVWDCLRDLALPKLLARRKSADNLRIWCVGCSTGEEAYSLAILFAEALNRLKNNKIAIQIFASDISPDAIVSARRGQYPLAIAEHVSSDYLAQYFNRHEDYYQIKQSIRDMVLFAQQDVIIDSPFTRLDLIVCRNLMIYFNSKLQNSLLPLFHFSLLSGGMMLLGSSESIGPFHHLFSPIEPKFKLYDRLDKASNRSSEFMLNSFPPLTRLTKEVPVAPKITPEHSVKNLQSAADHVLLQVYSPAAVVVNPQGDIVYISGRTGKYLEPAAGKADWNFHAMVRDGLRSPLYIGLKRSLTQIEPIHLTDLKVQFQSLEYLVDVTIQTFQEPTVLKELTMVVFHDIELSNKNNAKPKNKAELDLAHESQLQQYRYEVESLREENRASKEELQSSNEELQSTNEELQSMNEELTTSKEEMQSMNEELQTINTELQTKLDDLALAQSDMQNILNSIEIAILFLDQKLNVRRFTDRASKIISLRGSDVGRPLSDLTSCLLYPELHKDAQETLDTLKFSEKEIPSDNGRRYSIRIMPYRRLDNVIDGVVITMVDITHSNNLDSTLPKEKT